MTTGETKVRWPGSAFAADADDLSLPIRTLLNDLRLLEKPEEEGKVTPFAGTPVSVQVITSGATSLSKWWTAAVAGGGGIGAIISGLKGLNVLGESSTAQRAVFTASASFLAAAVAIAVAIIVWADVSGRATASSAEYSARSTVAAALLQSFEYGRPSPTQPTPDPQYVLRTRSGEWHGVKYFTWDTGRVAAIVSDGRKIASNEIAWVISSAEWSRPQ